MESLFLIILPALAGLFLLVYKNQGARQLALMVSLVVFGVSVYMAVQFNRHTPAAQFYTEVAWLQSLGISLKVGVDGLGMLMVLLTTFLTPLIILSSFGHNYKSPNVFYGLILIMQSGLIGVFVSLNAFLFYLFWEAVLIPVYFLALIWGGPRRNPVTFKFFIYTITGSLLMLAAFIYIYLQVPVRSFDVNDFYAIQLHPSVQCWLFWAIFIAFAIKMPVFPFHTWQPDTYSEAPIPATMLLSGIMLKMAIYGLFRWLIPVMPDAVMEYGDTALLLSVIGIVYASCIALVQKDMKRVVAYSSIAHVGLISAGVLSMTHEGMQGAVLQMLSHGVVAVGLFFIIDIIIRRTKTIYISDLGGIAHLAPKFSVFFMIVMLASVALPLTSGFWGEFLLLAGVFQFSKWMGIAAGTTVILGAVYMLRMYQRVMLGETNSAAAAFGDLEPNEKIVAVPLIAAILVMGIYPSLFLDIAQPSIDAILRMAKMKMGGM